MRPQDMIVGENYRHKTSPNYGWAKMKRMLKPKEFPNTATYIIAECEWTTKKNGTFGLIKYFRPSDLLRDDGPPVNVVDFPKEPIWTSKSIGEERLRSRMAETVTLPIGDFLALLDLAEQGLLKGEPQ